MSEALVERLNAAEIALRDDRPYAAVAIGEASDRIEADAATIASLRDANKALTAERDEARGLVTEANNSLYGSQGYFHSLNGGPYDKYHLASRIENLKSSCRTAERKVAELEAERDNAIAMLETQAKLHRRAEAREARLSEALRNVRRAIMEADPAVLTDTFWMPSNVFKGGTVVDFIDAALSGSGSGWREPDGWKLVPVESYPEMIGAFWRQKNCGTQEVGERGPNTDDYSAYRAMIAASPAAPTATGVRTKAADDVLAERKRQVEAEGWTPEHDDAHGQSEMATAAACYALATTGFKREALWEIWPKEWGVAWFKPTTNRRNLVKAGALILAEIERLDRLPAAPQQGGE